MFLIILYFIEVLYGLGGAHFIIREMDLKKCAPPKTILYLKKKNKTIILVLPWEWTATVEDLLYSLGKFIYLFL